jgi:hypothetical protein
MTSEAKDRLIADMLATLKSVAGCPQAAMWLARLPMPDGTTSTYDAVTTAIARAEKM